MKKIMILGAGVYQVPLIKQAKEMGFFTIVVSVRGKYPGFKLADQCYFIDIRNYKKVLDIARYESIDAILTTGSDVAMITVGYVCDALQLSGISFKTAQCVTDKALMKDCFVKNNVKTASFYKVYNEDELKNAFQKINSSAILKVVDSSGSRGIVRVDSEKSLLDRYQEILPLTQKPYIIIEEFIDGTEFGIDAIIVNNELQFVLPHKKIVYQNDETAIPIGHEFPLELNPVQNANVYKQVDLICSTMHLNNCAINIDAFLCGDEIYIIETGARAGATGIPELISGYTDINYYEMMIRVALNEPYCDALKKSGYWISRLLLLDKSGIIKDQYIPKLEDTIITIDYEIGDEIREFKNGSDRIGQIIVHGDNEEIAKDRLDMALKKLVISVKE